MSKVTKRISSASVISVSNRSVPPSSRSAANWRFSSISRVDAFLDRTAADEFVHQDVALLTDAKGAVGRLVLHRRIPPAVEVDDVRGRRQIQAGAAGLEGQDEKRRAVILLELIDQRLPLLDGRFAVQHQSRPPEQAGQEAGQRIGHLAELSEHQRRSCREAISSQISASRANLPLSSGAKRPSPSSWLG